MIRSKNQLRSHGDGFIKPVAITRSICLSRQLIEITLRNVLSFRCLLFGWHRTRALCAALAGSAWHTNYRHQTKESDTKKRALIKE